MLWRSYLWLYLLASTSSSLYFCYIMLWSPVCSFFLLFLRQPDRLLGFFFYTLRSCLSKGFFLKHCLPMWSTSMCDLVLSFARAHFNFYCWIFIVDFPYIVKHFELEVSTGHIPTLCKFWQYSLIWLPLNRKTNTFFNI